LLTTTYLTYGTTRLGAIASAARVPAVREASKRDDGDGVRVIVDTLGVIYLRA
jgi:hypothetical protein